MVFKNCATCCFLRIFIQSDQKVSVHLMITIQKVTSMFKVSPASLQTFIDTLNCILEDCVQYSMVHIPNVFCDGHLQPINCVGIVRIHWVFHRTPEKKIEWRKIRRCWRSNGFRMDSVRKHVHMHYMSRSTILLKVGLVNFIFFQCTMKGYTIVSQYCWELRVSDKKMGPTMRHSNRNTKLLIRCTETFW
jgi:hypothetical protein